MSDDRVRVVVVGAGDFGMRHIRTIALLPEFELVAIADLDAIRLKSAVDEVGARAFSSLSDCLSVMRPDAVVIATPAGAHAADLRLATGHRLPVLVEKPVVATAKELDELAALDEDTKSLIYPAHISRFLPSFAKLRGEVAGRRIRMIRAVRVVPAARVALHGDTHPALAAMVHDLDLIRALVRAPLLSVHSEQSWTDEGRPFPQTVVAHLRFADATIASVDNSWSMPHTRQYIDARMEVFADEASAFLALPSGALDIDTPVGSFRPDVDIDGDVYGIPTGALATQLRHFAASVAGRGVERAVSLDEALWSVRTAFMIADQQERA